MEDSNDPKEALLRLLSQAQRHCLALELSDTAAQLTTIRMALGIGNPRDVERYDLTTLLLTLETCYHMADELGQKDVRQAISLSLELLQPP